jgi:pyruvate dehydrogenase E2 component (dihydrolipoamide acetyltransferase)
VSEPEELTRQQQAVARRVAESKATIPHLQLRATVEPDPPPDGLSVEARVVAACGAALRRHPLLNGSYRDGRLEAHSHVNVAVTIDGPKGTVMPTIADADQKDPAEIGREIKSLRMQADAGEIPPSELSGATFTVADLSALGVSDFEAVIVPPQAGILAIGAVGEGLTLTLGCDARLISGTEGARFLNSVREGLERT